MTYTIPCTKCHNGDAFYTLYPNRAVCGQCYDEYHDGDGAGYPYQCTTHNMPSWSAKGPYPDCEIEKEEGL
jgi:hypothetical protein